jgi:hypothetical protein
MEQLLADLDADRFDTRGQASHEQEKLGELAEPALRKLLESQPLLDLRRAANKLLAKQAKASLPLDRLQVLRAIEAREQIGSAAAKERLRSLGAGPQVERRRRSREPLFCPPGPGPDQVIPSQALPGHRELPVGGGITVHTDIGNRSKAAVLAPSGLFCLTTRGGPGAWFFLDDARSARDIPGCQESSGCTIRGLQ